MAFRHLDQWWFIGMPIKDTALWFPYFTTATGGADMTNHFLRYGIASGLGAMVLLVILLTRVCSSLGKTLAALRSNGLVTCEYLYWGLGVLVAVHIFNWLGITYFDQTFAIWYMQLAVISSLTEGLTVSQADIAGPHPVTSFPPTRLSQQ